MEEICGLTTCQLEKVSYYQKALDEAHFSAPTFGYRKRFMIGARIGTRFSATEERVPFSSSNENSGQLHQSMVGLYPCA